MAPAIVKPGPQQARRQPSRRMPAIPGQSAPANGDQRRNQLRRPGRLIRGVLLFGVLAGIAHVLTVLLIPRYAVFDAASAYLNTGEDARAELIRPGEDGRMPIVDADALTAIAVCGFDLADGPLRVSARTGQTVLSLSLHVRGGGVFYAVTDRAAQRGVIEFVVLDRRQFDDRAAKDDDGASQRELRIVSPAQQGIVVARALVKQPSDRPLAEATVSAVACGAAG